jgi:predicted permease
MEEELRLHLQRRADDLERQGLPRTEAERQARIEFGGYQRYKEECREALGTRLFRELIADVRYGLRQLRRNPGFTVVAVITLALGIGANTAIFSLVDGILLQPLPYAQPDHLVSVWQTGVPKGIFPAVRDWTRTMDVAAYSWTSGINLTTDGESARVMHNEVSANLFRVLGVRAALGRTFAAGEDSPGRDKVVILSDALWRNRFGSDPQIVGRIIRLDSMPWRVIGVMPANFRFPSAETKLWIPVELSPTSMWGNFVYTMIGRLRPGSSLAQARAEFKTLSPRAVKLMPWKMPPDWGTGVNDVLRLQSYTVGDTRAKLLILLSAVGLILLMACANVANLILGRSAGRRREIALRAALGAGRGRVVRQLLTESVLLGMFGGGLGLALAVPGLGVLKSLLPADTPRLASVNVNWQIMAFAVAVSVAGGLFFGVIPALSASKLDIKQELRWHSERTGIGARQRRVSGLLVMGEVALEVVVIISAALLVRSLWTLAHRDPGFEPAHLLAARVNQIASRCKDTEGCIPFYKSILQGISGLPGVKAAGATTGIPGSGIYPSVFSVEGHPSSINGKRPLSAWTTTVTSGYFRAMGIPLLRGRLFEASDRAKSPDVLLVSAAAARKWWPNQDPIGKRVKFSWVSQWRTVVGVVGDTRDSGLADPFSWEAGAVGHVYFPYAQAWGAPGSPPDLTLVVRAIGDPLTLAGELRTVVAGADPSVPLSDIQTMDRVLSKSIAGPRSTTWLFLSFGILALLLGTIGVYGIVSYSVACRTCEFGIRMALGATKQGVLAMVLKQGLALAGAGVTIGVLSALALSRMLSSLLYGISAHDWTAFVLAPIFAIIVAVLASYVPARRGTNIDPMVALRHE